jgi:hypothetical protein
LLPKTLYSYLPKVLYCYLPITIKLKAFKSKLKFLLMIS